MANELAAEAKHTPGPWRRDSLNHIWHTYQDSQGRRRHQPIADVVSVVCHENEAGPNADLVAKAPEIEAEIAALRQRLSEVEDKANRFDLDRAGIASREQEAIELVELRAKLAKVREACEAEIKRIDEGDDGYALLPLGRYGRREWATEVLALLPASPSEPQASEQE